MIPKIALLVIIFTVVAGTVAVLFKGAAMANSGEKERLRGRGVTMQRFSFFLLLALMAYVAASGAS